MRDVRLVEVPYDSGAHRRGLGLGPGALVAGGAAERLGGTGARVERRTVTLPPGRLGEVASAYALAGLVADEVRDATAHEQLPVVLAGNCGVTLGVVAGLGPGVAVVWADAHGDLHTPSTTTSGYLDGTCLATMTGRCWERMASGVPGFAPVPDADVVVLGAHALDPAEEAVVATGAITVVRASDVRRDPDVVRTALTTTSARCDRVHVHVDLDVLDARHGRANAWAAPGGLDPAELLDAVRATAQVLPLASLTIASWDPALDTDHRVGDVALDLLALVGTLAAEG